MHYLPPLGLRDATSPVDLDQVQMLTDSASSDADEFADTMPPSMLTNVSRKTASVELDRVKMADSDISSSSSDELYDVTSMRLSKKIFEGPSTFAESNINPFNQIEDTDIDTVD